MSKKIEKRAVARQLGVPESRLAWDHGVLMLDGAPISGHAHTVQRKPPRERGNFNVRYAGTDRHNHGR
ncbi:MAG: hypothetical protein WCV86_04050 [Patescibacteria group bacterium]